MLQPISQPTLSDNLSEDYLLPDNDPRSHISARSKSWSDLRISQANNLKIYKLCIDKILDENVDTTLSALRETLSEDYNVPEVLVLSFIRWIGNTDLKGIYWKTPENNDYIRLPILRLAPS
jgi:hypothetical protein